MNKGLKMAEINVKKGASTELPRDFCAGIGPLQLGVVLVFFVIMACDQFFSEVREYYSKILLM